MSKTVENREKTVQKIRKTVKNIKNRQNMETPVKNRQKYRKP